MTSFLGYGSSATILTFEFSGSREHVLEPLHESSLGSSVRVVEIRPAQAAERSQGS